MKRLTSRGCKTDILRFSHTAGNLRAGSCGLNGTATASRRFSICWESDHRRTLFLLDRGGGGGANGLVMQVTHTSRELRRYLFINIRRRGSTIGLDEKVSLRISIT